MYNLREGQKKNYDEKKKELLAVEEKVLLAHMAPYAVTHHTTLWKERRCDCTHWHWHWWSKRCHRQHCSIRIVEPPAFPFRCTDKVTLDVKSTQESKTEQNFALEDHQDLEEDLEEEISFE